MAFGFVLFPDLEELDLVGPWETAALWAKTGRGPDRRLLIAETIDPVRRAQGMTICPDVTLEDCPSPDYLLVPGGEGARNADANEAIVRFIREQARHCKAVLSVCTGTFFCIARAFWPGGVRQPTGAIWTGFVISRTWRSWRSGTHKTGSYGQLRGFRRVST